MERGKASEADMLEILSRAAAAARPLAAKAAELAEEFDVYPKAKRAFDIAGAAGGLLVLAPLMGVTAALIRLESEGPVIYRATRLGKGGREFVFLKFRSMFLGAEKGGVYERKNDPRVTKVGRFIRATSIDELPQLVNILKGDMSIIGPRPVLPHHPWPLDQYSPEERRRFDVRPGLTGWAQIHGRKDVEWHRRLQYDVYYVDHMGFALDAQIFLTTILQVLRRQDNLNVEQTVQNASPNAASDASAAAV